MYMVLVEWPEFCLLLNGENKLIWLCKAYVNDGFGYFWATPKNWYNESYYKDY